LQEERFSQLQSHSLPGQDDDPDNTSNCLGFRGVKLVYVETDRITRDEGASRPKALMAGIQVLEARCANRRGLVEKGFKT